MRVLTGVQVGLVAGGAGAARRARRRRRGGGWGSALVAACLGAACGGSGDEGSSEPSGFAHAGLPLEASDVPLLGTELLGRPTDHSVTIKALAALGVEAYFELGTAPGCYSDGTSPVGYADGAIEAVLDGLTADTRYYYRMRYRPLGSTEEPLAGAERTFHTQRAPGASFVFAVQSDSHQGFDAFYSDTLYGQTLQNIASATPDLLVDLGDTFSLDGATETEATVRQKYLDQRAFFALVGHSTPVFLVPGNHENEEGWNLDDMGSNRALSLPVLSVNARKRYFVNPVPGAFYTGNDDPLPEADGDHLREDYFAFEWGDALFVGIDPFTYTMKKPYYGTMGGEKNDEVVGNRWDWTLGERQYHWLKQTLEGSTKRFKFVFAHHLAGGLVDYSRGGAKGAKYVEWGGYAIDGVTWRFDERRPGWEKPIHQLMADTGVTVFFHGHDHVFATEQLDGVVYQETPHAANDDYGIGFASNPTDYPGAVLVANSGHLRVTVAPEGATVEYVRSFLEGDGENGSVAHSYTVPGHVTCADEDTDEDGTNDCDDGCPTDPAKVEPGACGCGAVDGDGDADGAADCVDGCPTDPVKTAPGACGCGVDDGDDDGDGTADCADGCPADPRKVTPGVCGCGVADGDGDGDGTADCADSCPMDPGKVVAGVCGCGVPDLDGDADGVFDCHDGCPTDPGKVGPGLCGCGVADADGDADEVPDCSDGCPADPGKTEPGLCGCGVVDDDEDGDGSPACTDGCPGDPLKIAPGACGCGESDVDGDGDGLPSCAYGCPSDPLKASPGACGCGVAEDDGDGDGLPDCSDGCPGDPLKVSPGACGCGVSDADGDGDGLPECNDVCPADPAKTDPGLCGCGVPDLDGDGDGSPDCLDGCASDPGKMEPGLCGCGVADLDGDGDGSPDCADGCPADPDKIAPGTCGCGVADLDGDADGVPGCNDACPADPAKATPGACGCGVADVDSDVDGIPDCNDACPTDPFKLAPGGCGCGAPDQDGDGDGALDCADGCPSDPLKAAPGACGCGVGDDDADGDGTVDCLEAECDGDCVCRGATLVSNDASNVAPAGTVVVFTANSTCDGGTASCQFRLRAPNRTWTTVRAYGPANTYTWNTTGRVSGIYTVQVQVREETSTVPYQSTATRYFTLLRKRK